MKKLKKEYPFIISASRRSDIPAFHSDWLIDKFKENELIWQNPFNASQKKRIFLNKVKVIVFWSKNPESIIQKLDFFDKRDMAYYFHFTLNDYPENLEPFMPKLKKRIDIFKKIIDKTGKNRVIWRFDPIILTDEITKEDIYTSLYNIGKELNGYTNRLILSFVNLYPKVKRRMLKKKINFKKIQYDEKIKILKKIADIGKEFNMQVMSCADEDNANHELEKYNIIKGRCVDPDLISDLFNPEGEFKDYIKNSVKDKGQRIGCGCISSIDIGKYNTCKHRCLYCYAN